MADPSSKSNRLAADSIASAALSETIKKENAARERANAALGDAPFAVHDPTKISDEEHAATLKKLDALSHRKGCSLAPNEKYELPASSSQAYGFRTEPLLPDAGLPKLQDSGRRTCAETQYASFFFAQTNGLTPFSKADAKPKNAEK